MNEKQYGDGFGTAKITIPQNENDVPQVQSNPARIMEEIDKKFEMVNSVCANLKSKLTPVRRGLATPKQDEKVEDRSPFSPLTQKLADVSENLGKIYLYLEELMQDIDL